MSKYSYNKEKCEVVMSEKYIAHIRNDCGNRIYQSVREHLINTSTYAAENLSAVGLENCGHFGGIIHDMGKFTEKFRQYILSAYSDAPQKKGSVIHTFAAVIYVFEHFRNNSDASGRAICEIFAYAAGAHHGEFDIIGTDGESGFAHRLESDRISLCFEEALEAFNEQICGDIDMDKLFRCAVDEMNAHILHICADCGNNADEAHFLFGLAARLLLSAIIDGDRRDTAEFISGIKTEFTDTGGFFWSNVLDRVEKKLLGLNSDTPINRSRTAFSDSCKLFAQTHRNGIYRLTLPTGAGKTLSSLRLALANAATFGKKRIFFVIPLLTILEQNSSDIKYYIDDDSIVTEHHSNVIRQNNDKEKLDEYELLTETWKSPVIITTLVQLLDTLFSERTACIRRFSALSDSVIVIDEIQSLPKKTVSMFNMAMNYLAYSLNCTIILSSATQPCFDATDKPLRFGDVPDIVPYSSELFAPFKRTRVIDKTTPYGMSIEELADFSGEIISEASSLLIICNTKQAAKKLFHQLDVRKDYALFHLSASMCPAHRTETLNRLKEQLGKRKTICVSTQIIEAGVNVSFESVIRVAAGIDNLAQAAGRCNRNNDFNGIRNVYTVNFKSGIENLGTLKDIESAQRKTIALLNAYSAAPDKYGNDILSEKSINEFYNLYFGDSYIHGQLNYPIKRAGDTDITLYELLSGNRCSLKRAKLSDKYFLNQAFRTAGSCFEVFDESTSDIIVPYDTDARAIISDIMSRKAAFDYGFLKQRINAAKLYTIRIYAYQLKKLTGDGMICSDPSGKFLILNECCYDPRTGLDDEYNTTCIV